MTGKDIIVILSQGGSAIAGAQIKSHALKTSAETIEKASATQQKWKEFLSGRCEWSLTTDHLVLRDSRFKDVLKVGETFSVTIKMKDGGDEPTMTGDAILDDATQQATVGSLARGTFKLRGTGPLS